MRVLVIGSEGQVASSLRAVLPEATFLGRPALDLAELDSIEAQVTATRPEFIINAAAYTAVDQAETEAELAWRVNGHAVGRMVAAAERLQVPLLHLSTDYVFAGDSDRPYRESDPVGPLNEYGASKLQGEFELMAGELQHWWILRTSWIFSEFGSNFLKSMISLAQSRSELSVVNDQHGRPTYAGDLAAVIERILKRYQQGVPLRSGLYHCASAGVATWFEFAEHILTAAEARGLVHRQPLIRPVPTRDYPTRADRPRCSVLDTSLLEQELSWQPTDWRAGMHAALDALPQPPKAAPEPREVPPDPPRPRAVARIESEQVAMNQAASNDRAESNDFLVFGAPAVEEDDIAAVVACMRSGWLGTGPRVAEFEQAFRAYRGAPHAVAVNSCSAALHLSLLALDLEPGSEVITTPLTFCATVNAIIHAGLTPVLADVDPVTMNLDPGAVEASITARTRAILPVHFAGRPCDMTSLCGIAARHGLHIIEDCAHAIESTYEGQSVGTFGDFGCFSFYVTKNVTTGEGGMVLTANDAAQARIKTLALNGMSKDAWNRFGDDGYKHYDVIDCGFKYNMTDISAALGLRQLQRVEAYWNRREAIWQRYQEAFADLPVQRPAEPAANTRHAYHLYTLLVDSAHAGISRDAFMEVMARRNIGVGVHYRSLPEHPYYRERFGWRLEDLPEAARIGQTTVSLPLSARLSDRDVSYVVDSVRDALAATARLAGPRRRDG